MEEKKNKNQVLVIIGMIALVLVLFVGVKVVFAALDTAMPDLKYMASEYEERQNASEQTPAPEEPTDAPNFCPYCGEELFEGFQWEQYCPDCGKQVTNGGT